MKQNYLIIIAVAVAFTLTASRCESPSHETSEGMVSGVVFNDDNGNGKYDKGRERLLRGVAVSNGRDVVITDKKGRYKVALNGNGSVFVIKPRNYSFPLDDLNKPQFYRMNLPAGASGTRFPGIEPTPSLPESVDFPLIKRKEPASVKALIFGDTQPRNDREIQYLQQEVISELVGTKADFGVTLGDVVFDNLDLFGHLTGSIASIGLPWLYVPGNHDIDYTADNNTDALGAWYRTFGPDYYSFTYGPAHFIVLNNIRWIVTDSIRYYRTGLGADQLQFLNNEIDRIGSKKLLVLMMHIPFTGSTAWADKDEKAAFMQTLARHPNTLTLSAHTHLHYHNLVDSTAGFHGETPHHLVSMGTTCGSWWTGAPDEFGVPHSTMADGTPVSYAWLYITGNKWKLKWKAAGKPADFQMHVNGPGTVSASADTTVLITANIYNALPDANVKMRIGASGEWIKMKQDIRHDQARLDVTEREKELGMVPWRNLPAPALTPHIWSAEIPARQFTPGVHRIDVNAIDRWWNYDGNRLIYVIE